MSREFRIAIVVSHPIQHFCPQYASFSKNSNISLKVFFASALGHKKYRDTNFGEDITWKNLYLNEFEHVFLNNGEIIQADKNIDAHELDAALQDFQPDLLIIYGYFQKLQRRAYRWATKSHIPIAYISDSEMRHDQNMLKKILKYFYLRNFFSRISYFLTVGNANEEYYRYHGVPTKKILEMHFPINIRQYEDAYDEREKLSGRIKEKYGIAPGDIVISVAGKLVEWKRQGDLIEVLKLLETDKRTFHLFIIGSGPLLPQLKQNAASLTKNKVHFTGFVDPEELPAYYSVSDIYIHPAAIEPHSLSISEAIYMGCPIILSDKCGSYGDNDDVQTGKNGYVYKLNDIAELEKRIKQLVDDPALQKEFKKLSHELAVNFQQKAHYDIINKLSGSLAK